MDMIPGVWVNFVDSLPAELQNCRTVPVEFIKLVHAEDLLLLCGTERHPKQFVNVKNLQAFNNQSMT